MEKYDYIYWYFVSENDTSATKRKSEGGEATEEKSEGVSPEKKAKLEEKPSEVEAQANGDAEAKA